MRDPHAVEPSKLMPQSPSSVNQFETCPRQYAHKYIIKDVEFVETDAIREGNQFHRAAHMRLSMGAETPARWAAFEPMFQQVSKLPNLETELQMAIDNEFQATSYRRRLVGGAIDVLSISKDRKAAYVIDWKTGKPREDMTQLEINALCVFAAHESVERVKIAFAYIKTGTLDPVTLPRTAVPKLRERLEGKILRIRNAHENADFQPRPSGLCKAHCDVLSCEFNRRTS